MTGDERSREEQKAQRNHRTRPISQMGYEEARDELIEIVRVLEEGGLDLDSSLKLWERGEELAKRCDEHLAGARKRVEDALAGRDDTDT